LLRRNLTTPNHSKLTPTGHKSGHSDLLQIGQPIPQRRDAGPGVLVLPADLPLLTVTDVEALLACLNGDPLVALAPDRHEAGTNAMLIAPPGRIGYAFGPASFEQHRQMAQEAGVRLQIIRRPTLALDLDLPEDLALLRELQSPPLPPRSATFQLSTRAPAAPKETG
jgi:2-phospho-L-lactate guanylyltransferase